MPFLERVIKGMLFLEWKFIAWLLFHYLPELPDILSQFYFNLFVWFSITFCGIDSYRIVLTVNIFSDI